MRWCSRRGPPVVLKWSEAISTCTCKKDKLVRRREVHCTLRVRRTSRCGLSCCERSETMTKKSNPAKKKTSPPSSPLLPVTDLSSLQSTRHSGRRDRDEGHADSMAVALHSGSLQYWDYTIENRISSVPGSWNVGLTNILSRTVQARTFRT